MKTGKTTGIGILGWIAAALCPTPTFAIEGSGAHGGDPVNVRTTLITEFITHELRSELTNLLNRLNMGLFPTSAMKRAIQDMIDHDLAHDIQTSGYNLRNICRDRLNRTRAATAINNDLGGRICFNPRRLARENATKSEIVALAFHEHAHHFGISDADSSIQSAIFQQVQLSHPEWNAPASTPTVSSPAPDPTPNRTLVERLTNGESLKVFDHARAGCDYQIRYDSNTRAIIANQANTLGGAWHRSCQDGADRVRNVLCPTDLREGSVCEWSEFQDPGVPTIAHRYWSNRSHLTFTFNGNQLNLLHTADEQRCRCFEFSVAELMCWDSRCPIRRVVDVTAVYETN